MRSIRSAQPAGTRPSRLSAVIAAVVTFSLAGAAFAIATPGQNSGGLNNGGHQTSGGNASCVSGSCYRNPTDFTKSCTAVPGNGCHQLPDTPCERGHGGTEIGNKHCGPAVNAPSTPPGSSTPPASTTPPGQSTPPGHSTPPSSSTPASSSVLSASAKSSNPHGSSGAPHAGTAPPSGTTTPGSESVSANGVPTAAPASAVSRQASFTG